jgi:hypothetical protein
MVNDIWVNDGKGNELGNMYKESVTNGKGSGNGNPILDSMTYTRDQQQIATQSFKKEMAKNQAQVQQQGAINRQHNMVAASSVASSSTFSAPSASPALSSNSRTVKSTNNNSFSSNSANPPAADTCNSLTPPLSSHPLPIITSKGKDHQSRDGAIPTLLRKADEYMERTCGNKYYRVAGQFQPTWNREVIEDRNNEDWKFFDVVELTLKEGQVFSCLCTPSKTEHKPGRSVTR